MRGKHFLLLYLYHEQRGHEVEGREGGMTSQPEKQGKANLRG